MLADSEGSVAETGHSGPLSRWGAGKTPPGAMFTVKAADGGVMVERTLETRGTADDDIVPGGVYNLKWYFAHGKISDFKREDGLAGLRFPPLKKNPSKFTLDFEAVAKQFSGACPFLSPPLWASLKKWVRKSSADGKKRTLCLTGAAPSFSGGDKEPVWDISELLDFHLWANRHLAKSGSRLLIFPPKNSPAHQMPSLRDIAV
jgi:hypothetical protein